MQWITTSIFALRPEKNRPKIFFKIRQRRSVSPLGLLLQNHIAAGNPDHSSSESEFEAPVPVCTDDVAKCIFCYGLFSQEKFGERRFQCTDFKSGLIVTALGTERILISFVACTLVVRNIPGSFMLSYYTIT